ncbi:YihY/virulence factor BrkB family protein [Rhodobacteraceae bacterium S2214]|nr:YihY/virulence factor BrkB family protein [Rhodobacteraceae bacterium S2214]
MFGVFPGIAAVIAVFGLVADPVVVSDQLELMRDVIPQEAYGIFEAQIKSLLSARSETLGWTTLVSIMLALWSSRAAVGALMSGINAIEAAPQRGGVRQMLVALLLTASLVLLATVALMSVVVLPVILAFIPLPVSTTMLLEGVRWLIALAVLFSGLSILYRYGPNMKPHRRPWITLGAAIVVVVWIGASAGLSYYLTNFASYNEVYGSIGAVIGMLLWLYISAYLILWGAIINAKLYYIETPTNEGDGPPEQLL